MDPRKLQSELEGLRSRLRGLWVFHGVLKFVAVLASLLAFLYLLDRNLTLPRGVRLVLLAGTTATAGFFVVRGIVYPLRRRLDAKDIACAVEERFPEFDGRLVSTLELEGDAIDERRNISVEMVERLRAETGALRDQVQIEKIFNYDSLKRLGGLAAILLVLVVGYGASRPQLTGIFVQRLFGSDTRWPQLTFLSVVFPEEAEYFAVEYDDDRPAIVRIARGASLPVTVSSTGVRPDFVELRASGSGGRMPSSAMTATGPREWVGRFRAVREGFEFWPIGGDDDGYGREVKVEVLQPPEISNIELSVAYPDYTEQRPIVQQRGDVEAPIGSRVDLRVAVEASVTSGEISFDGGKEIVAMRRLEGEGEFWGATFLVTESRAYSVHLIGDHGFHNLEPATYSVIAVRDRPPSLRLLEPARSDSDVTPTGLVAFRVVADDDYGLQSLALSMRPFSGDDSRDFDLLAKSNRVDKRRELIYDQIDFTTTQFPHGELQRPPQEGDSYVYRVVATDNHVDPDGTVAPHETVVSERRVDVVSANEKLRLLTDRQIRMKEDVRDVRDLQKEKRDRLQELLTDYESADAGAVRVDELEALEIGQRQVTNRALRLTRGFADVYEEYLLNRIDGSAAAERLIPMLLERKRASAVIDDFDFSIYRPMVEAYQSGTFGDLDVLGRMLVMLAVVLDVSEIDSPQAGREINDARLLSAASQRLAPIRSAIATQDQILARLDDLLEKLDEWEDYQGLVSEFRELLEVQRSLYQRTKGILTETDLK